MRRDIGLDAARGVALICMFVAHFGPTGGPGNVLVLSEYVTAFLFVLLIGCGAELAKNSHGRWRSTLARGMVLVLLGVSLAQLDTQIVVILVWLGVMTVVATWLTLAPWWALLLIGVASVAFTPDLMEWSTGWLPLHPSTPADPLTSALVSVAFANPYYRLAGFLLPVCAGILLIRHGWSARAEALVAAGSLAMVALLKLLDASDSLLLAPYSGTRQELVFDTALALLATTVCALLARRLRMLASLLAATGAMTLTIYVAQIVGDWAYFRYGGQTDDHWAVLIGACVGALALGAAWRPVARRTGWRGPLEGQVDALAHGRWPSAAQAVLA